MLEFTSIQKLRSNLELEKTQVGHDRHRRPGDDCRHFDRRDADPGPGSRSSVQSRERLAKQQHAKPSSGGEFTANQKPSLPHSFNGIRRGFDDFPKLLNITICEIFVELWQGSSKHLRTSTDHVKSKFLYPQYVLLTTKSPIYHILKKP